MEQRIEEVRIRIVDLKVGMFVSRLDRPWLETSFPFQGILVRSVKDIEQLKQYGGFVYVDVGKGLRPARSTVIGSGADRAAGLGGVNEYRRLHREDYKESSGFHEEIPQAEGLHRELSKNVAEVMDGLRSGGQINIEPLRQGISEMVESILRNPHAVLWVNRVKQADSYTFRHLIGVSIWCGVFGRYLGLERDELKQLALSGLLADVGKSMLPKELLDAPRRLGSDELKTIRAHVDHGVRILAKHGGLPKQLLRTVATHHERWDGSGYPVGLTGTETPIFGRVLGLVDCYEAMTSPRPYRRALTPHDAIGELYEDRGSLFQPELVEQFIQACGIFPTGSLVELNSGEVAVVIGLNGTRRLRPKLMLLLDADKRNLDEFISIDLSVERPELFIRQGLPPGAYGVSTDDLFL